MKYGRRRREQQRKFFIVSKTFLSFAQQLLSLSHFLFGVRFYCNFTFMTHLSHFLETNSRQVGFREQQLFSFSVLYPLMTCLMPWMPKHCCRRIGKINEKIKFRRSYMKTSGNIKAKTWKGVEMSVLVFELHICKEGWDGGWHKTVWIIQYVHVPRCTLHIDEIAWYSTE